MLLVFVMGASDSLLSPVGGVATKETIVCLRLRPLGVWKLIKWPSVIPLKNTQIIVALLDGLNFPLVGDDMVNFFDYKMISSMQCNVRCYRYLMSELRESINHASEAF